MYYGWILLGILKLVISCQLPVCKNQVNCPVPLTENANVFSTVCMNDGTEQSRSGIYDRVGEPGLYNCACCGNPLFPSTTMFDSGTGWPSFWAPFNDHSVSYKEDSSCALCGTRVAVECYKCGIHLGHVFDDGPPPTDFRYCMNSVCLHFKDGIVGNGTLSEDYFEQIPRIGFSKKYLYYTAGGIALSVIVGILSFLIYSRVKSRRNQEGNNSLVDDGNLVKLSEKSDEEETGDTDGTEDENTVALAGNKIQNE